MGFSEYLEALKNADDAILHYVQDGLFNESDKMCIRLGTTVFFRCLLGDTTKDLDQMSELYEEFIKDLLVQMKRQDVKFDLHWINTTDTRRDFQCSFYRVH